MKSRKRSVFPFPSSRSGMELAINTVVVIILGVAILIGGIYFMKVILSNGEKLPDTLTAGQRNELNLLLSRGQLVAVAPMTQTLSSSEPVTFGVAIDNRLDENKLFNMSVIFDSDNPNSGSLANWSIIFMNGTNVNQNSRNNAIINVGVKKQKTVPKGVYTFIVNVTYDASINPAVQKYVVYDSTRFFTVIVD